MKKQLMETVIIGTTAIILATSANAQNPVWYLGLSAGQSDFDTPVSGRELKSLLQAGGVTSDVSIDDTDTGVKLFAGYRLTPNIAFEAGWVDLGKISIDVDVSSPESLSLGVDSEIDGLALSVIGIVPIDERLEVFGRIGVYSWDANAEAVVSEGGTAIKASDDDDGSDPVYGIGVQYDFTDILKGRAEWERYDIGGDDVDLTSLGIAYQFE